MTEIKVIILCTECQLFWSGDAERPSCVAPDHDHQRHEVHRHRTLVVLPDNTEITAVSFDDDDPYTREQPPDFGLYLDARWRPPWPHEQLDWPDFGTPANQADAEAALRGLLDRARKGQRVEIGCLGAHGRTGTALAYLAALCGHPPADAVAWVRSEYCPKAVETDEQAAFVAALAPYGQ